MNLFSRFLFYKWKWAFVSFFAKGTEFMPQTKIFVITISLQPDGVNL